MLLCGLHPAAASGCHSPAGVRRLPTAAASLLAEQAPGCVDVSGCGTRAPLPRGMCSLPGPGVKPMSAALAGGFFTTGPPGKSVMETLKIYSVNNTLNIQCSHIVTGLRSLSLSLSLSLSSLSPAAQLCPTLCHPMDCSPPGSSVHGILQARTLEWVAISFSRESS